MRRTFSNSRLAVCLLLAVMMCADARSNEHAILIEFSAIPIHQEPMEPREQKGRPAASPAEQVGPPPIRVQASPSQANHGQANRGQLEQFELPEWAPWVPVPEPERTTLRVAERPRSEKITDILREADQIGSEPSLPLNDPNIKKELTPSALLETKTKHVGGVQRTDSQSADPMTRKAGSTPPQNELNSPLDERRPIAAEFTNESYFTVPPQGFSHQHFHNEHVTPMTSADVMASGYDGLVDSYVGQLLAAGCATPQHIPGTISLLNPPIGACQQALSSGWYAQANALFLRPIGSRDFAASVDSITDATRLDIGSLHEGLSSGASALLGVRTGTSAIEFEWWSLFQNRDQETATDPAGNLRWLVPFEQLDVDPTGAAQLHQLSGEFEVHSFEFNKRQLLSNREAGALQFAYIWGVRFVRFRDALNFQADASDTILNGSADEYAYEASVDNRLFGPQIGGAAHWQIKNRLAATLDFKTGVFYNYVEHDQSASGGLGPATIVSGTDAGRTYLIDNSTSQASMIAELKLNLEYVFRPNFRCLVGYRLFGAQNVATAASQIPRSFENLSRLEPDAQDAFLLHGLQFGFDASF